MGFSPPQAASLAHVLATKHPSCVVARGHGDASGDASGGDDAAAAVEAGLRRAVAQMSSFMAKSAAAALDRAAAQRRS
jgi:hypothetical protein